MTDNKVVSMAEMEAEAEALQKEIQDDSQSVIEAQQRLREKEERLRAKEDDIAQAKEALVVQSVLPVIVDFRARHPNAIGVMFIENPFSKTGLGYDVKEMVAKKVRAQGNGGQRVQRHSITLNGKVVEYTTPGTLIRKITGGWGAWNKEGKPDERSYIRKKIGYDYDTHTFIPVEPAKKVAEKVAK